MITAAAQPSSVSEIALAVAGLPARSVTNRKNSELEKKERALNKWNSIIATATNIPAKKHLSIHRTGTNAMAAVTPTIIPAQEII